MVTNPDDPVICVCADVHEQELIALIRVGVTTVEGLRSRCGAKTGCGGCRDDLLELIEDELHVRQSDD